MSMTISEKILARAAKRAEVAAGEYVRARADSVILCDLAWTLVGPPLAELGAKIVEPERVVVAFDHAVPALTEKTSLLHSHWRAFCKKHGITHLHDIGDQGISHVLSVEKGYARPGTLQINVDTHANTCGAVGCFAIAIGRDVVSDLAVGDGWYAVPESIQVHLEGTLRPGVNVRDVAQHVMSDIGMAVGSGRVIELVGPFIEAASVPELMTLCNWTRKTQAVSGIVNPTATTIAYVKARTEVSFTPLTSDPDASYVDRRRYDVSKIEPLVAAPPDPLATRRVADVVGLKIQQAFVGSCAGGSLEDLRATARVLAGRRVHQDVRMIATPGSTSIWQAAEREGILRTLSEAGVLVTPSTCGVCYGGMGLLAPGEVCLSTSTENFPGRMGSPGASIWLASPLTVAASALAGEIVDPRSAS